MSDSAERGPWLDILKRKHECGPSYSPPIRIEVEHEGRILQVLVPHVRPKPRRLELKAIIRDDSLLCLIGRHTLEDGDDPYECGIVMIARRDEEGRYVVHVWHELFPYALEYLGLTTTSHVEYRTIDDPPDDED